METAIPIDGGLVRQAEQILNFTNFKNVKEFAEFLIREKIKELEMRKNDPIFQLRGILKGKSGGTELFMQDKQAEIRQEYDE